MVDLVTMSMGVRQMRYLVPAREDMTNHVEDRALTNKMIATICRFLIEEVICWYECVGKIVADRGKLDAYKATELFEFDCLTTACLGLWMAGFGQTCSIAHCFSKRPDVRDRALCKNM